MEIKEKQCATALSKSKLKGFSYSLNPYTGCQHGCKYCYARFIDRKRKWGSFIDPKMNIAKVLRKELKARPYGTILISSVTDPYNELELKYELTRSCLEEIVANPFPVTILTKSSLIERDIDLIKKLKAEVGFSINTLDENVRKAFEPGADSIKNRIKTAKKFSKEGIKTYIFLGPILPNITNHLAIIKELAFADHFLVDKLNIKCGNWQDVKEVVIEHFPKAFPDFSEAVFDKEKKYYLQARKDIRALAKEMGINVRFCY